MEKVHKIDEISFISEEISLQDFFLNACQQWMRIELESGLDEKNQLALGIGCSPELIENLQNDCA